jgi:hypothetical protein
MPQRKVFVATRILAFDFELFIGVRCEKDRVTSEDIRSRQLHSLPHKDRDPLKRMFIETTYS